MKFSFSFTSYRPISLHQKRETLHLSAPSAAAFCGHDSCRSNTTASVLQRAGRVVQLSHVIGSYPRVVSVQFVNAPKVPSRVRSVGNPCISGFRSLPVECDERSSHDASSRCLSALAHLLMELASLNQYYSYSLLNLMIVVYTSKRARRKSTSKQHCCSRSFLHIKQ